MKTKNITCILSSAIIALMMTTTVTFASIEPPNDGNIYITDDGAQVYYDNNAQNGGITTSKIYKDTKEAAIGSIKVPRGRARAKYLSVSFQTQQNNYYCGPASASMIVRALGFNKTQNQMASLLGTTAKVGTPAGDSVARALNQVAGNKATFRWVWHHYSKIHMIEQHIVGAIDHGNAVMLNTMERPGDWYLAGHNTGYKLFHFGVVRGYNRYTGTGAYMDPAYGRFKGFVLEQHATFRDLSYAAGGRGYAW